MIWHQHGPCSFCAILALLVSIIFSCIHLLILVLLAGVLHQKNSFCKGIALLIEAEEKISDLIRQLLEVPSWASEICKA